MNTKYVKIFFAFCILFSIALAAILLILPKGIFPKLEFQSFIPTTKIEKNIEKFRHDQFASSLDQNPEECNDAVKNFSSEVEIKKNKNFKHSYTHSYFEFQNESYVLKEFLDRDLKKFEVSKLNAAGSDFVEKNNSTPGMQYQSFLDRLVRKEIQIHKIETAYLNEQDEQMVLFVDSTLASFQGNLNDSYLECFYEENK